MSLPTKTVLVSTLASLLCAGSCSREGSAYAAAIIDPDAPAGSSGGRAGLLDASSVNTLTFEVAAEELEAMSSGSHRYGHSTLRCGGRSLADVGLRYKGSPAKEAASGKPDFNVELNEFVSGQSLQGLKRLVLYATRGDPSYLSAPIGLELFRQAGVPAARFGFARVRLNDRDLGLYVVVEGVDRTFLRHHFARNDGNLYDEGPDTDVDGQLEKYGGKKNPGQQDVDALAAAAKASDPARRWGQLRQLLDVDRFVTYAALEVLLALEDGYAVEADKFRIYHDPAARLVFFPKNVEVLLRKTDLPLWPEWRGLVAKAVFTTAEGEQQYRKTVESLLDTVFEAGKVQARARELAAVVRPAAAGTDADAGRRFDAAVDEFCSRVARRADDARRQLGQSWSK